MSGKLCAIPRGPFYKGVVSNCKLFLPSPFPVVQSSFRYTCTYPKGFLPPLFSSLKNYLKGKVHVNNLFDLYANRINFIFGPFIYKFNIISFPYI